MLDQHKYALVIFLFALLSGCQQEESLTGRVQIAEVEGKQRFTIEGEVFHIKGLAGSSHIKEAAAIGANTIRTYDTTGLSSILDSAQAYGLMVVAGIWLPKSHQSWLYKNDQALNKLSGELAALGRRYSDHPALLSWCLGNELIYYDPFNLSFSRAYNRLIDSLKTGDPEHPIGSAFANFGQRAIANFALKIRGLDFLIINTFGRLPKLNEDMKKLDFLNSKPFLIGEFGENGPWEATATQWGAPLEPKSSAKAALLKRRFQELPHEHPNFLGALAFNWGWRQEQTHTWFNVFSKEGEKNALYYALAQQYGQTLKAEIPAIESLLIDQSDEVNTFWFESGEEHLAELQIATWPKEPLEISWSIRTEDWYFIKANTPPPLPGLIEPTEEPGRITFRCPPKPGPYRLFVKVSDQNGNFATANLPFYVVQ